MSDISLPIVPQSPAGSPSSNPKVYWQSLVNRQSESGLTIKAFCQQHKLTVSTFYAWRKRLGHPPRSRRSKRSKDFVRVSVAKSPSCQAELSFPNGVTVRLSSIDLKQLMACILDGGA